MDPAQEIFDVVRAGNTGRLQQLLDGNPRLATVRNERGHTPVLIAQYHHQHEAVVALLRAEPELDIFDAASVGRAPRVAEWLDRDPALLEARSSDGFSPLGLAAFFGHAETVQLLLARGADPKAQNAMGGGASAIGLAAMKGHHDILKLLKGQA
jgi:ankyrin repeat protein